MRLWFVELHNINFQPSANLVNLIKTRTSISSHRYNQDAIVVRKEVPSASRYVHLRLAPESTW
jgi:hypothetical protein